MATPGQNINQQPPPPGSCTSLISSRLVQPLLPTATECKAGHASREKAEARANICKAALASSLRRLRGEWTGLNRGLLRLSSSTGWLSGEHDMGAGTHFADNLAFLRTP